MTAITDPTALADQHQAAERHLTRILARKAPSIGMTADTGPVGPWLAAQVERFADQAVSGELFTCEHLENGPAAAFAALSTPGLIVCHQCTDRLVGDRDADMLCDRCERPAEEFEFTTVTLGAVGLMVAVCGSCADLDHPHQ